jgi:cytochrome c5
MYVQVFRKKLQKQIIKLVFFILFLNFSCSVKAEFLDQSAEAIEARIAPIGKVRIAHEITTQASSPSKTEIHLGRALFESHCVLCHGNGIAGAPRLGNTADWQPRINKKLSLLLKHVENGYRAMPPKGACLECSSDDLEAAIRYMIKKVPLH